MIKVTSEIELKLYLQFKAYEYLTSDSFTNSDREYIFLENNIIKFRRLDDIIENFNFKLYKKAVFRPVQRVYDINNL